MAIKGERVAGSRCRAVANDVIAARQVEAAARPLNFSRCSFDLDPFPLLLVLSPRNFPAPHFTSLPPGSNTTMPAAQGDSEDQGPCIETIFDPSPDTITSTSPITRYESSH